MKHTRGPWRLQIIGAQEADLISGGTFMGLTGGSGAPNKYEPDDAAEWLANAHLVKAAPDMHEAIRNGVNALKYALAYVPAGEPLIPKMMHNLASMEAALVLALEGQAAALLSGEAASTPSHELILKGGAL